MSNKQPIEGGTPPPANAPVEQRPGFGGFADRPEPDPDTPDSGRD